MYVLKHRIVLFLQQDYLEKCMIWERLLLNSEKIIKTLNFHCEEYNEEGQQNVRDRLNILNIFMLAQCFIKSAALIPSMPLSLIPQFLSHFHLF